MKLSHLKQIVEHIKHFKHISAIHRINDNTIKIAFDRDDTLYFSMIKGDSYIYKSSQDIKRSKVYQAPFDVVLAKQCNRSSIDTIELHNEDKILRLYLSVKSAYKAHKVILQFEFTGKNVNVILLDDKGVILEALRHIDADASFRVVKVGITLLELPKNPFEFKDFPIDNVDEFLVNEYNKRESKKLESLKKVKIEPLRKKIKKLQTKLESLDNEAILLDNASTLREQGHLLLNNLHVIKPYALEVKLDNYSGESVKIVLNKKHATSSDMADELFKRSKKDKQRATNLYIQRDSLSEKVLFLEHFIATIESATSLQDILFLFPKRKKGEKVVEGDGIETFYIEGYKVQLGKNEKGNIELLKRAKAKDIWLHLKERASAHVIISTDKQNLPMSVIESAALLCVNFSVFEKSSYLVDYTTRREVKVQERANVLYNKYKTISIDKK